MKAYLVAVSEEARDRQTQIIRTVESYFPIRRNACISLQNQYFTLAPYSHRERSLHIEH